MRKDILRFRDTEIEKKKTNFTVIKVLLFETL